MKQQVRQTAEVPRVQVLLVTLEVTDDTLVLPVLRSTHLPQYIMLMISYTLINAIDL